MTNKKPRLPSVVWRLREGWELVTTLTPFGRDPASLSQSDILRPAIPNTRYIHILPPQNDKIKTPNGVLINLVAEVGIAPTSGGYEPPEILLLHSAHKNIAELTILFN